MMRILVFLLCTCCIPVLAQELPLQAIDSVIYLTKNTNNNQVHYGVQVDEKCRPLEQDPAYAYWKMLEQGPEVREELKFWEQPGYGVRQPQEVLQEDKAGHFELVIRGVPERQIRLETLSTDSGCAARAYSRINDKSAVLQRIDIHVSGWANVHKVEIFGIDVASGEPVSEVTHQE